MIIYYHEGAMLKVFWWEHGMPGPGTNKTTARLTYQDLKARPWASNLSKPSFKKKGVVFVYNAKEYEGYKSSVRVLLWQKAYKKIVLGFEWICYEVEGDAEDCWASRAILWRIVDSREIKIK